MKMIPYKIGKDWGGYACFEVDGYQYTSEVMVGTILEAMKKTAESYLRKTVNKAVITVPAYFSDAQREQIKDAGWVAGLDVQRIISEPIAAALSYGLNNKEGLIAVLDLGGGTFDVSILKISNGVVEVKATNGNSFLGGEEFDNALLEYLVGEFKRTEGIDLMNSNEEDRLMTTLQRLREAAEKAKIELSSTSQTEINLPFITADKHMNIILTRSKFESLVNHLIEKIRDPCKICLKDAGISSTEEVDEFFLVGGMAQVPKLQLVVSEIFGKTPVSSKEGVVVNPDEAVAIGAAIQGGILAGDVKNFVLSDVACHSVMSTFELKGIPPALRSMPHVEMAFTVIREMIKEAELQAKKCSRDNIEVATEMESAVANIRNALTTLMRSHKRLVLLRIYMRNFVPTVEGTAQTSVQSLHYAQDCMEA